MCFCAKLTWRFQQKIKLPTVGIKPTTDQINLSFSTKGELRKGFS